MKRISLLLIIFVSTVFGMESVAMGDLTRVAEGVYSYVDVKNAGPGNSYAANAGIVVGSDGIAVIDTLISAKEANRFIRDIRKVSSKPILYVIDTHSHLDHSFGNSEFAKLGAVIVGHANCRANMLKNSEDTLKNASGHGLTPEQMEGTQIAYPSLTFTDRMSIYLGDREIDLIYFGPSHTSGSIIVHVPDSRLLFSGDILFTDFHPYIGDGDIPGWVVNLDRIAEMDVDKIIPGHGPISGKKDIAEMKSYITAFDKKARELAAQTGDVDAVATELKKALPVKSQAEWMIPYNLRIKYMKGE